MLDNHSHGPSLTRMISVVIAIVVFLGVAGLAGMAVAQQAEEEPNNAQSAATPIDVTLGETTEVNGILGLSDEDWFAFDVQEGEGITVDYSGTPGEAWLRGPDGSVLDAEGPTIRRLQADASESGTHYIQLSTVAAANGDYSMDIMVDQSDQAAESQDSDQPETVVPGTMNASTPESNESDVSGVQNQSGEMLTVTGDGWPDSCEEAPTVNATGVYNGTIDSPGDQDVLRIQLQKGDFVTVEARAPTAEHEFQMHWIGHVSIGNMQYEDGVEQGVDYTSTDEFPGADYPYVRSTGDGDGITANTSWAVFAEKENATVCIRISEESAGNARFPYEWELSLNKNSHEPYPLEGQVLSPTEIEQYEERLSSLEQRVDELEQQRNQS